MIDDGRIRINIRIMFALKYHNNLHKLRFTTVS